MVTNLVGIVNSLVLYVIHLQVLFNIFKLCFKKLIDELLNAANKYL